MTVAAVAVAFDTSRDLGPLLRHVPDAVDHFVLVDNSTEGHPGLVNCAVPPACTVIHNANRGGLAGAYNVALSRIRQQWPETTHVLFLDDDTDTAVIARYLLSEPTRRAAANPAIAAVAPIYRDRETGLRCSHIRLERFRFRSVRRDIDHPIDVTFVINSMSLWRLDALARLGAYSTELAVDHIDTDYCLRAKQRGYRIVLNPTIEFLHSIGKRRSYRLFGFTFQACGYGPERRHMIAHNTTILLRKYMTAFPAFAVLCVLRIGYEATGIVMAEDDRLRKLHALVAGAWRGLITRHAL
jgi:rhamnosyltransferase